MHLYETHRPKRLEDVAGQDKAVASIRKALKWGGCGGKAWSIVGPSGMGKTTLAKIIAGMGAAPIATREESARSMTVKTLGDIEEWYATGTLPIGDPPRSGRAVIVNEYHGLRKDTATELLDVLERIPQHACWVFTTTSKAQKGFFEDDSNGDRFAFVSRCQEIVLDDSAESRRALAKRAKELAMRAGIDGLPESAYETALAACNGNMRMLLQRVESGQLLDEAREELERQLLVLPLDNRGAAKRAALQEQLAKLEA
jgi:replication-associated recombination protein RarA